MLKLYNTLNRKKQTFKPLKNKKVGIYTCGPTVYDYAHIGNLRTYIFEDILRRVLEYNGYKVKHVMNITDVGHLTSDADTGEDKIEVGARRERKTAWEIADFYAKAFQKDLKRLNIEDPHFWPKATAHIKEQVDLIKILGKKGFTYLTGDGVYFDTSKFGAYGKLADKKALAGIKAGARIQTVKGKKNPTDFALWKFTPKGVKRQMEWSSPWGRGFPGWHIECSAMSMKYLGKTFDIHCGAIDHIPIHHTNEIAQAEAATGKKFVNFWLHGEFLLIDGGRMGKSEGNLVTLQTLIDKDFNPLSFRYLVLTTHYRSKLNFTWRGLKAAQNALNNLYNSYFVIASEVKQASGNTTESLARLRRTRDDFESRFLTTVNNDLNTPKALAIMWEVIKDDELPATEKKNLLLEFDKIFGLGLAQLKPRKIKIPKNIKKLVAKREQLRKQKKWQEADKIRKQIEKLGYKIEDTELGPKIKKFKS